MNVFLIAAVALMLVFGLGGWFIAPSLSSTERTEERREERVNQLRRGALVYLTAAVVVGCTLVVYALKH